MSVAASPANSELMTVVLDRDGVINQDSDDYIKSPDEWIPVPGSLDAIARLTRSGYRVVVATNQSGIARQLFDEYALARIHHKMCSMVEDAGGLIDGVFYCPHAPDANCTCRKPATGLLLQIEQEFACSLESCFFIGDTLKDVEAARAHGCRPVLVRTGKGVGAEQELLSEGLQSVPVFDDLAQAVQQLFPEAHA